MQKIILKRTKEVKDVPNNIAHTLIDSGQASLYSYKHGEVRKETIGKEVASPKRDKMIKKSKNKSI